MIIFQCGHSFHADCLLTVADTYCFICGDELRKAATNLVATAKEAIFSPCTNETDGADEQEDQNTDETEPEDDFTIDRRFSTDLSCLRIKQRICRWGLIPGPTKSIS